jgi:hypothetical protein
MLILTIAPLPRIDLMRTVYSILKSNSKGVPLEYLTYDEHTRRKKLK